MVDDLAEAVTFCEPVVDESRDLALDLFEAASCHFLDIPSNFVELELLLQDPIKVDDELATVWLRVGVVLRYLAEIAAEYEELVQKQTDLGKVPLLVLHVKLLLRSRIAGEPESSAECGPERMVNRLQSVRIKAIWRSQVGV